MRALKVIVVVMGVLLVAGIVALGFAVRYRVNHPRPVVAAPLVPAPLVTAPVVVAGSSAASPTTIDLPAGAQIRGAEASGDRLVVRVTLIEGGEELIIVNLATGAPVSTIILKTKTGTP